MSTKDILIKARALIADPEKWTQHALARNRDGAPLETVGQLGIATCYCSVGAVAQASVLVNGKWASEEGEHKALDALRKHLPSGFRGRVIPWNDAEGRTHAEVLKVFDRAIEATS